MVTGGEDEIARARAVDELLAFYDSVDVTLETYTQLARMRPLDTTSGAAFASWLRPFKDQDEDWSYWTYRTSAGSLKAIAMPTTNVGPETRRLFPFVEVHQTMSVWWLTAAWRARQLLLAADWTSQHDLVVPAAACARGLAETAAQLHADVLKVAAGWDALKRAMTADDGAGFAERIDLLQILTEATMGGKFDEKVPELRRQVYGRLKRSNVLTAVDKLTRVFGPTWQEDYQWLCNVVHPSVGNFLGFSTPFMDHESGTHLIVGFSGKSLAVRSGGEWHRQAAVATAIERTTARSARVLLAAADDALRVLDDIALSTRASEIATFDYWRAIRVGDRQALCPCRSGQRAYRCHHELGDAGPQVRALAGDPDPEPPPSP